MSGNKEGIKCIRIEVEVQENGIIRDMRGWLIGRADDGWMRYQWRMLDSGICPCCGKKVSEFPDADDILNRLYVLPSSKAEDDGAVAERQTQRT